MLVLRRGQQLARLWTSGEGGKEATDITAAGPLPHAGTGKQRRNLYWRNHERTSCGKSGAPWSREGQESLCWWLCFVQGPGPVERRKVEERSKHSLDKTNSAENLTFKNPKTASSHTPQRNFLFCCNNKGLVDCFSGGHK